MPAKPKPLIPMDHALRRRGIAIGAIGLAVLFGTAVAIVFTPTDYLVFLLVLMLAGFVLIVAGFIALRRAEREAIEKEITLRKP